MYIIGYICNVQLDERRRRQSWQRADLKLTA